MKKAFSYFSGLSENEFIKSVTDDATRTRLKELLVSFINRLDRLENFENMINNNIIMSELRADFITSHAVFLEAVFLWGNQLIVDMSIKGGEEWSKMEELRNISLLKTSEHWIGRCIDYQGKMVKNAHGVNTTAAKLCSLTNIPMSDKLKKYDESVVSL